MRKNSEKKFVEIAQKILAIIVKEKGKEVSLNDLFKEDLKYKREVDYIMLETKLIESFKLQENIRLFDLLLSKKHKNDIRVVDVVDLIFTILP